MGWYPDCTRKTSPTSTVQAGRTRFVLRTRLRFPRTSFVPLFLFRSLLLIKKKIDRFIQYFLLIEVSTSTFLPMRNLSSAEVMVLCIIITLSLLRRRKISRIFLCAIANLNDLKNLRLTNQLLILITNRHDSQLSRPCSPPSHLCCFLQCCGWF